MLHSLANAYITNSTRSCSGFEEEADDAAATVGSIVAGFAAITIIRIFYGTFARGGTL